MAKFAIDTLRGLFSRDDDQTPAPPPGSEDLQVQDIFDSNGNLLTYKELVEKYKNASEAKRR